MATGGFSADTSDEVFDYVCSMCKEQNKTVNAAKYCVDCHDYYCSDCVNIHKSVPALKGHKIVDKEVGQEGKLPMVPTERCERHSYKPVDMYCQSHHIVECYTCMAVDHRTCQDVFYVPEFVKTRKNVVPEFLQRITNVETKLQDFLKSFNRECTDLQDNKLKEIDTAKRFTKSLEERIKEAEKDAIDMIEKRYTKLNEELQKNTDNVQKEVKNVGSTRADIDSIIQNESQAFVSMIFGGKSVSSAEKLCRNAEMIKLGRRVKFLLNPQCESLMAKKLCLGKVKCLSYSFVRNGEFNIKLSSDSSSCAIYGSCILADGSVIFSDRDNCTLKLIDGTALNVIHHYKLSSKSWEVCCMDNNEAAVCLPDEKKVLVVKVNHELSPERFIRVEFSCQGISFHDEKFYIADGTCLYICTTNGAILKTISRDSSGKSMFKSIFNVSVCRYNRRIFVNDIRLGVISLDIDGNIQHVVSNDIKYAHGLTEADNGKVLACGYSSKNVILLDENGAFEKVIIKDGLSGPMALCFNCSTGRLYVPNFQKDVVQIFELEDVD
ncbi:E3 ubiquitin-protein ligase TRIM71-like [Mercenaria mercenaria]|uniref:E3 ubiquitin-protein ligase TRIM71-like n=1 Tax=Mercenaria mercenaria TaxID=6596 RepID=UPI00234ECCF5|nr:E3 ubiquitin-protein ligase TRIM71-like [Mercenaria mercenaria]